MIKILVVDDDPADLQLFRMACSSLEKQDKSFIIEIEEAENGEIACEKFLALQQQGEFYNCIIMDRNMPGLSGIDTTFKIRQLEETSGHRTPIIGYTSFNLPEVERQCLDADMDDFVAKHLSPEKLKELLLKHVIGGNKQASRSEMPNNSNPPEIRETKSIRVLIAEDDPADRVLIKKAFDGLDTTSLQLEFVDDGDACWDYLQNTETAKPNIIFLDITMPGKDGLWLLKEIRQHTAYKSTPVVMLTHTNDPDVIQSCLEQGASSYLVKPLHHESLTVQFSKLAGIWTQACDEDGSSAKKVLLVDDDELVRNLFLEILILFGCEVDTAVNGEQAVEKAKESDYKLILTDMDMPEMDGLEEARAIRRWEHGKSKRTPIVGITGGLLPKQEAIDAGMDDLYRKPISLDMLRKMLESHTAIINK